MKNTKAKNFKEQYEVQISIKDIEYRFSPEQLKEYYRLVCKEIEIKIGEIFGVLDISEITDVEF